MQSYHRLFIILHQPQNIQLCPHQPLKLPFLHPRRPRQPKQALHTRTNMLLDPNLALPQRRSCVL